MTLAFSTTWPQTMPMHMAGQRTNFVEQIRLGLTENKIVTVAENHKFFPKKEEIYRIEMSMKDTRTKIHTIRRDEKNRWKLGKDIHFVINNRTKQRFQFAQVVKCLSVQKIEISWEKLRVKVAIDGIIHGGASFWKPGDLKTVWGDLYELAINDGFNSELDFLSWFNKDFTGKIIHWTNLKY